MRRVVFVGEAPGRNTDPSDPLNPGTASGQRLLKLTNRPAEEFTSFRRVNLLPAYPGEGWDGGRARRTALKLMPSLHGCNIILLGRAVEGAFAPQLAKSAGFQAAARGKLALVSAHLHAAADAMFLMIPHPSGKSQPYNDEGVRSLTAACLHALLADDREQLFRVLRTVSLAMRPERPKPSGHRSSPTP